MKAHIIFLILSCLVLSMNNSIAQSIQWVKQTGAKGYSLKADMIGNFYITGSFENNIMFSGFPISSNGGTDIYIAKFNMSRELVWVKSAGGEGYDEGYSIAIDPNKKYVYTTGLMDNALFEDTTITGYPFFIAKHDSSGNMVWVKALVTNGGGGAPSISTDSTGNIYFVCSAYGLDVPDSLSYSGSAYFIAKLSPQGTMHWIKGTKHYSNRMALQPLNIVCDRNSTVYVTGALQTCIIEFDSTHQLIPEGTMNAFIVKYDSSGNVLMALQSKGTGVAVSHSIVVDSAYNFYISGFFEGSIEFGDIMLESAGESDIFIVKYDSTGAVQWALRAGGPSYENSRCIDIDRDGNVYIAGINSKGASFSGDSLSKSGAFVAKYDGQGNMQYVKTVCSIDAISVNANDLSIYDIALLGNDSCLVAGFCDIPVTFVAQDYLTPLSFILNQNYPNPFNPSTQITYSVPQATDVTLKIYDVLGREIATLVNERKQPGEYKVTWHAEGIPTGIYFYRLTAGEFIETKKMVVVK